MNAPQARDFGSLSSKEVRGCPIPFFKNLLSEAPVYRDPGTGHYIVTRYADVIQICNQPRLFLNQADIMIGRAKSPVAAEVQKRFRERGFPELHTLSTADHPNHPRFRGMVDKVFTPTFVKGVEPKIRKIADDLIDAFVDRGSVDVANEFANLLPMFVIVDKLGLPRDDWKKIRRWSDVIMERNDPVLSGERELELTEEVIEMQNYLHENLERFRREPQDCLLSAIANVEDEQGRLTDAEAVSISFQIMVGGNETSATAILSAVYEVLQRPDMKAKLLADPLLIPSFVEEVLRMHSPVPVLFRLAAEDTEVAGVPIARGSTIVLSWMGANLDPGKWGNPDEFDIARKGLRSHLTFGRGAHFCLGHLLAKAELRTALERLLTRLPNMRLSADYPAPQYVSHAFVHLLDSLHLEFDRPSAS